MSLGPDAFLTEPEDGRRNGVLARVGWGWPDALLGEEAWPEYEFSGLLCFLVSEVPVELVLRGVRERCALLARGEWGRAVSGEEGGGG